MTTTRAMPDDCTAEPARRPAVTATVTATVTAPVTAPVTVTVRAGRAEDHAAVAELVRTAYAPYRTMLPRRLWSSLMADLLDLDRHTAHGHLVVAEVDGTILGSGLFYPDSSRQGLGWPRGWAGGRGLAVHPSARGRGLATALLAECERLSREVGAAQFAFHTLEVMAAAVALYERLGYERAPRFDADLGRHYGVRGGPRILALAYRRDLQASAA